MREDMEARADRALDALDTVVDLLSGQSHGGMFRAEGLAQLLSIVGEAVREVMPDHGPRHPAAANE